MHNKFFFDFLVAIQCLNETFNLNENLIKTLSVPDLATLITSSKISSTSSDNLIEAERQKVMGNEFVAANKPDKAVECYDKAIQLDPNNAIYFSNRAAAYSMLGEHFKSLEDAKESCKLNPSYSKAFNRLGKAYMALGEPEEAIVAFEKALELGPNDVNIKSSLEAARRAASGDNDESVIEQTTQSSSSSSSRSSGMPNLGGLDFSSMLNNPQFMTMAQQMMQSGALKDMLKDPKTMEMMNNMMGNPEMMKKFAGGN